jgi:hypothetical protein
MSSEEIFFLAVSCACCLVPFLAGVAVTLIIQARQPLGKPWCYLPWGGTLKHLWEDWSR